MAYFRKRGDKWSFTVDIGVDPISGKRKQKTSSGYATKKEAQAEANKILHELGTGTYIKETEVSFTAYGEEWIEAYKATGRVKKSTVRSRKMIVDILSRYFSNAKVKDITRKVYQKTLNKMKPDYSDNTMSTIHGVARMMFASAKKDGLIKIDPTEHAIVPRTAQTVEEIENNAEIPKYLEKEELAKFLRIAKEHGMDGDYETYLTLAYTGMRLGEFLVLRESDIDFEECVISITKTYFNEKNKISDYELLPPKTKKSTRKIDVEPIVIKVIEDYLSRLKPYKMAHRKTYHDKGFIMPNTEKNPGYPRTHKTINDRMRRLLKIAELNEDLTPHSLRHTHTSLLAEAGVTLEEIMDRLGHQNDMTTKSVYLHVTKTRKKEASKMFGDLMKNV